MTAPAPALAIFAGQFPVLRNCDIALIQHLLAQAPRCLVLVASAYLPRSIRNPFSWEERAAMIRQALPPGDGERVVIQPLRERFNDSRLARDVQAAAAAQLPPQPGHPVLLARAGEGLGFALPAGWSEVDPPGEAEATPETLRDRLLASDSPTDELAAMALQLPSSTVGFLAQWQRDPEHERLRQEWRQVAGEKQAWSVAPYPVVLVTVDAVVRCGAHVLLIRRGRPPGKGLRALPGGFLDPSESVLHAAIRELVEETQIDVPEADVRAALRDVRVFDHPRRSQRGRVITHAHYFDLGERPLPRVLGSDDAAHAEWVPMRDLPAMEAQFLDDHYQVLEHFLRMQGAG